MEPEIDGVLIPVCASQKTLEAELSKMLRDAGTSFSFENDGSKRYLLVPSYLSVQVVFWIQGYLACSKDVIHSKEWN